MSAPITEAHRKLAADLCRNATGSNRALHHVPKFAQLIADSEARAVAEVVNALTCTHHNDQQRIACPVCLVTKLTSERDLLRACLRDLVEEQNGAPLELRRKQWQAAMDEALAALAKTEDAK